jgi:hypothetical protein
VAAKGYIARGFADAEAVTGLEPLTIHVDETNQGDRHIKKTGREPGNPVKALFRIRIEDFQRLQCSDALVFIVW